jgi:hypothetical protein
MPTYASYPASIVTTFTTKQNNVDLIDASDPNSIQAEVLAVETTLGITPNISGKFGKNALNNFLTLTTAGSSTPDIANYIYAGLSTFSTVSDRITNVEGLANYALSQASTIPTLTTTVGTNTTQIQNNQAIAVMGGY